MTDEEFNSLKKTYGDKLDPALDAVEYEYPDGSGSWVQTDPAQTYDVAQHYARQACRVWINGEPLNILG